MFFSLMVVLFRQKFVILLNNWIAKKYGTQIDKKDFYKQFTVYCMYWLWWKGYRELLAEQQLKNLL